MAIDTIEPSDIHVHVGRTLAEWQEPGAAELSELAEDLVRERGNAPAIRLDRLKRAVYRLRFGSDLSRSLILKRHKHAIAAADRLLAERWLPAIGLSAFAPRLVAAAAERSGCSVWHVYEDLGDQSLAADRSPQRLAAGVEVIARVHVEAAGHALLPEIRWRSRDHSVHFTAHLRDAAATLALVSATRPAMPREAATAVERLVRRVDNLIEDAPRLMRMVEDCAGPATLLHGDLWPKNVFVTRACGRSDAWLIDWDHVGVGSFTYDVSTFLYQSAPDERSWIWRCYRDALERAGWNIADNGDLNQLFLIAQTARYVQCILWAALSLVNDGAEWAVRELVDYDRWFQELHPPLA